MTVQSIKMKELAEFKMNRNMMEGFIEVHTGSSSRQALETDSILNIMRCMCKIKAFNLRMRCYYTSKILEEKHIIFDMHFTTTKNSH